jgi:YidC/Oxa1 family membrane protein insertase
MDKRTVLFVISLSLSLFGIKFGFNYYDNLKREEWLKQHPQSSFSQKNGVKQHTPKKEEHAAFSKNEEFQQEATDQDDAQNGVKEQFYVLENNYQQFVFSNIGAALVELNLPFQTKENPKSVVLPIDFDRDIKTQSPKNAEFPLHDALLANGLPKKKSLGGYYPLLRRTLLLKTKTQALAPHLYGLNIVSDYPEVAKLAYRVKSHTKNEIIFEATTALRRITKRFSLLQNADDAPYCLNLEVKVEGDARGLWLTSGVPEVEWISGAQGSVIKYNIIKGKNSSVEKIDLPKDNFSLTSTAPDWVCNSNGFFGCIINPMKDAENGFSAQFIPGVSAPSRLSLIDQEYNLYPVKDLPGYVVKVPLKQTHDVQHFRLFMGPFDDAILKKVDAYYAQEQGGRDSNYLACQTFHGFFAFISEPFAKFLFFLMKLFHSAFGSWALSIFLITCVLRLLLYPLNSWSARSMKAMQIIGPQVKSIQERYKKDPQKAQLEIMQLYRQHGVNPLSGCLPLLIQMPFLIGMFDLLKSAFELRGACFIPGWINDLSAPDVLFSWNYPLPLIGNEFHLLPFALGAIMFVQQNLMSNLPKDRSLWTDQQRQQRAMGNIMTLVMTVLFYQFPSGLNIYWISSMLLGILQQWWTNKKMDAIVQQKGHGQTVTIDASTERKKGK